MSIIGRATESYNPLYSSLSNQFELCLTKCRTSSKVSHLAVCNGYHDLLNGYRDVLDGCHDLLDGYHDLFDGFHDVLMAIMMCLMAIVI